MLFGYNIETVLAEDAVTCLQRCKSENGYVLIKTLKAQHPQISDIARLENEFELARTLGLACIGAALEERSENGIRGVIWDNCPGIALRSLIVPGGIGTDQFLEIAVPVVDALASVHNKKIVHRGLHPGGILVDQYSKYVRIGDLGSAVSLSSNVPGQSSRHDDYASPVYMAPEQMGRSGWAVDRRSDLYSLGVIFYELLTGEPPFQSDDALELVHAHLAVPPLNPSFVAEKIPEVLSAIVLKLLSKLAEDRYQSAEGLAHDLARCQQQLDHAGEISTFQLGNADYSDRFKVSKKLFGREKELEILDTAFEDATRGKGGLLFVSGYSGVGKSALIETFLASKKSAVYGSGKFDQIHSSTPFSAIIHSFRECLRVMLVQDDDRTKLRSDNLKTALGANAALISDSLAELQLMIGPQDPVAGLSPNEAQVRFRLTWQAFLRSMLLDDEVLILFLDDLQWADLASLNLLEILLEESQNNRLLLFGAYRDNEVSASHPLQMFIERHLRSGSSVRRLPLVSLDNDAVRSLIADTLDSAAQSLEELVATVLDKAGGNPFFTQELLRSLYEEGILYFDYDTRAWTWDSKAVAKVQITDNVADLLTTRFERISTRTQDLLRHAACIGHTFELAPITTLEQEPYHEIMYGLQEAVVEGLIIPLEGEGVTSASFDRERDDLAESLKYRFLHDRIQQVAHDSLSEDMRVRTHLELGRLFKSRLPGGVQDALLAQVVHHLNLGSDAIDNSAERVELAELNLIRCNVARASTAYDAARTHATKGIDLLGGSARVSNYDLSIELNLARAESEFLSNDFENAESLCDQILSEVTNASDRGRVYALKALMYASLNKNTEAITAGKEAARVFGIRLPRRFVIPAIPAEILKSQIYLRRRGVDDLLNLPAMSDERRLRALQVLSNLMLPAFVAQQELFVLLGLKMLNASLRHGNSESSPFGYLVYGVLNAVLGRYDKADAFGRMALDLNERLGGRVLRGKLNFAFADSINHWKNHYRTDLVYQAEGYSSALEMGDLAYADLNLGAICEHTWAMGTPLSDLETRLSEHFDFGKRSGLTEDSLQILGSRMLQQFVSCLKSETNSNTSFSNDNFSEEEFLAQKPDKVMRVVHGVYKLMALFIFGHFEEAFELSKETSKMRDLIAGHVFSAELDVFRALILTAHFEQMSPAAQRKARRQVKGILRRMKRRARNGPHNYTCRHLLVRAEYERVFGREGACVSLYHDAISSAQENGFLQIEAIASELAGRYYLKREVSGVAQKYLRDSHYAYLRWGALEKVTELERRYSAVFARSSDGSSQASGALLTSTALDVESITRASLALSGEIVLEKLLSTLTKLVLHSAGAQKVMLVLVDEGDLVVEAKGGLVEGEEHMEVMKDQPLEECDQLPQTLIKYASKTKEYIVLSAASDEGMFTGDPYIRRTRPQSILCAPLMKQGELTGLLYLENNATQGAFSSERMELIKMLSSQIAISIENARLYNNLERKVEKRTDELQQSNLNLETALDDLHAAQAQLIQAEKLASLGMFTAGIAHEIKNPLNFVTNFAEVSNDIVQEVLDQLEPPRNLSESDMDDLADDMQQIKLASEQIANHGRRADAIVARMMEHASRTGAERESIQVSSFVEEFVDLFQHTRASKTGGSTIEIQTQLPDREASIFIARQDMSRALINIMENAADAIDERINLQGGSGAALIEVILHVEDQFVILTIKDNGTGISDENKKHIFEPFFTTKPTGQGNTGLGLSLTYDIIVGGHNGILSVDSTLGEGSSFILQLPIDNRDQ